MTSTRTHHPAPDRTVRWRDGALLKGDNIRREAIAVRAQVADGTMSIQDALVDPRSGVSKVRLLLGAQRRWGAVKARCALAAAGIGPDCRVRDLTDRQRNALLAYLEDRRSVPARPLPVISPQTRVIVGELLRGPASVAQLRLALDVEGHEGTSLRPLLQYLQAVGVITKQNAVYDLGPRISAVLGDQEGA